MKGVFGIMEPDGWPYIQLLASAALLALFSLCSGVASERATQREAAESGIGEPLISVSAHVCCALLLAWNLGCLTVICASAAALLLERFGLAQWLGALAGAAMLILGSALAVSLLVLLPRAMGRAREEEYAGRGSWLCALPALPVPIIKLLCAPAKHALIKGGVSGGIGAVTEEDVLDDVGVLGDIDDSQREMIGNIFELDDVTASDIMTHRLEMEAVSAETELAGIVEKSVSTGYSRLPVYEGSLDNIIGVLSVKDLLPYVGRSASDFSVRALMRPTLYVHESCRARDLLIQFKKHKMMLAVVVDEYGGTAGIVRMEDILESIVGDIEDEYDEEESLIAKQRDGSLLCDGYAEVEDVCDALGVEMPEEDVESDTIGGLLTVLLGRIPEPEERASADFCGARLTSLSSDERRISRVCARLIPAEERPDDAPAAKGR